MIEPDQNPDDGVHFDDPEPEVAEEVETQPEAPTGEQKEQEDTAPVVESDGDATPDHENGEEDVAEVAAAEDDNSDLKKMQHSLRVQAYEKRELKRRLKELEESRNTVASQYSDKPSESGPPKVPKMSDPGIEYDEDKYAEQLEQYHAKAAEYNLSKAKEKEAQAALEKERKVTIDRFVQGSARLASSDPEYAELVSSSASTYMSDAITEAVLSSEKSAELHREILRNPDRLDALNRLSPAMVGLELGRIESKLAATSTAPKPLAKKVSSAPPPVEISKGVSKQPLPDSAGIKFDY